MLPAAVLCIPPVSVCQPPQRAEPWETTTQPGPAHSLHGAGASGNGLGLEGTSLPVLGQSLCCPQRALCPSPAPGSGSRAPFGWRQLRRSLPSFLLSTPVGNLAKEAAEASATPSAFSLCLNTG